MGKLIIFDLDNTLVQTRPAAKNAYKQAINFIARAVGRENDNKKLYNHWKKIVQRVMGDTKPQVRRFEYSLGMLLDEQQLSRDLLPKAMHVYKKNLLNDLEVQHGARDLLKWITKEEGHTVVVSTESGRSEAKNKLKAVQLIQYIDDIYSSDDIGQMKPDPRYFEVPIKDQNFNTSNTMVVGDSEENDIAPARKLGLRTALVPHEKFHLNAIRHDIEEFLAK